MIDIRLLIEIIVALIIIGGCVISFVVTQAINNLKIKILQDEIEKIKIRNSKIVHYQMVIEKDIIKIKEMLKHIQEIIEELKKNKVV